MSDTGIAVVNNDPTLLMLLQELLMEAGYETTTYITDADTYQHLRDTQPRLIILDIGLNAAALGFPLLKLLQLDPQTVTIPILVTTVDHVFIRDKAAMLQALGCDVLELPAPFEALIAKVERLFVGT